MSRNTHAWFWCYWWEVMKKPNTHSLTIYIACIFTYTVTFSCVSFTRIILCLLAVGKVWECWVSMKLVFTVSFHVLFVLKLEFIMILRQIHLSFFIFIQVYFSNTFLKNWGHKLIALFCLKFFIKFLVLWFCIYIQLRNCCAYQALENSENHKIYLAVLLKQLYFYIRWSKAFPADTMLVISLLFPEA